jgi:hypothetical protein
MYRTKTYNIFFLSLQLVRNTSCDIILVFRHIGNNADFKLHTLQT